MELVDGGCTTLVDGGWTAFVDGYGLGLDIGAEAEAEEGSE